ncbi:MAG: choice-of-anchor D domain-containing protein [Planctomycetota bacterium]|nr:choice-of-anchor D domain-containing protein [Planctomycetota bacterium]
MRRITLALLVLTTLLPAACGGGGGGGAPPAPTVVNLGLVPADVATPATVAVTNPLPTEAEVTDLSAPGPFVINAGQLPTTVAAGATIQVGVTFTPAGTGPYDENLAVQATGAFGIQVLSYRMLAEAEVPSLGLLTANVAFGDLLPGDSAERTITLGNTSTVTTLSLFGATVPDAAFAFTDAFPIAMAPGTTRDLTLRYAPAGPGAHDTNVSVLTEVGGRPVGVTATTGGQIVVDLGTQTFGPDGNTPEMNFDVPADAISATVEALTDQGTVTGLRLLEGPGPREYENETLTGPYFWRTNSGVHISQIPNTDRPEVQLVPGGGTYRLKLWRVQGSDPTAEVRVLIERRPAAGTAAIGTLDLNVFLAAAIAPTAATAASDTTLQTVLTTVDNILAPQGIRLGDVDYYDVTDPTYDDVTSAEFGPLLALSSAASETRLNLFFVRTAIGGGILGVAATLGGPARNGTQLSGVMSLYSTGNPAFIGLVAAHEIGHFIGLAHTVEQAGSHDDVLDTAECPATGSNAACPVAGGGYLMHWQAVGGTTITDGQGLVIRGHVLVGPRLAPPPTVLQTKPAAPWIEVDPTVPQDWCGTCRCQHKSGR